jgi:hypothetical protein
MVITVVANKMTALPDQMYQFRVFFSSGPVAKK